MVGQHRAEDDKSGKNGMKVVGIGMTSDKKDVKVYEYKGSYGATRQTEKGRSK